MNILFLENHAVFARQVTSLFLSDHQVTAVPSLSAAHEALASQHFTLALVDYDLDDGKGDEFIRDCQSRNPPLPTIGVSSREDGNVALLAAGATSVCPKMEFHRIREVISGLRIE